jgi:hypothetical protein
LSWTAAAPNFLDILSPKSCRRPSGAIRLRGRKPVETEFIDAEMTPASAPIFAFS